MASFARRLISCDQRFRDVIVGSAVLFVLINLTLLPFIWGNVSLRDSAWVSSIYATGSREPAPATQTVYRDFDAAASAWQTEPWFAFEHDVTSQEHIAPLWNPYSAFGAPLAANMQSQPFSPFAWVAIANKSPRAFDVFISLRFFAAGVFALLFLRLFVSFWPALIGSATFMYIGYFWLFVTIPEISAEVTLPAMLFGVESLLRRRTASRVAVLALALALGVVGGMPEALLLELTMVYAYAVFRLLGRERRPQTILASAAAIVLASGLAMGLSAVALGPFFEYVPRSWNLHSKTFTGLVADSISPAALSTYLSPLMLGTPWNDIFTGFKGWTGIRGFFGIVTSYLAILATIAMVGDRFRSRPAKLPVAFFAGVALFCFSKQFGLPALNWVGSLPGYRLINFPKYQEAELGCSVAVLAAFGATALLERRVSFIEIALAATVPLACLQFVATAFQSQVASYAWYF